MIDLILDRAAELLATAEHRALPLERLHAALDAEFGSALGSTDRLRRWLERRPDRFLIVPPAGPVLDAPGWPAAERAEYRHALEALGLPTGTLVALLPAACAAETGPDWHRQLDRSLAQLLALGCERATLLGPAREALAEASLLRRGAEAGWSAAPRP